MANHAHVTTKKHMTPEKVRAVLDRLNKEIFFDCLEIEDSEYWTGEPGWYIRVKGENVYQSRMCWLNSRRHFEMRHGGGRDFVWWVDQRIQDEISRVFDGRVKDDGGAGYDEVLTSWNMPDSYPEYVKQRNDEDLEWVRKNGRTAEQIFAISVSMKRSMLRGYPRSYREPYKAAQRKKKHEHV